MLSKSKKKKIKEWLPAILIMTVCMISISTPALASSGGFEWEDKLKEIADSITGPVAVSIALIAVAGVAAMLLGGNQGPVLSLLIKVVVALTIILNIGAVVAKFGSGSGGLI